MRFVSPKMMSKSLILVEITDTRVITGLAQGGSFPLAYLILVECVDGKYISQISLLSQILFGLGGILAAINGYFLQYSWKFQFISFGLTVTFSLITCLIYLPESPRWLYSKGKYEKSRAVLRWIAQINRRNIHAHACSAHDMNESFMQQKYEIEMDQKSDQTYNEDNVKYVKEMESLSEENDVISEDDYEKPSFFHLCGSFRPFMVVLGHLLAWSSSSMMFCGLNFAVQDIGANFYLNSVFLSACEVPTFVLYKLVNSYGRKWIITGLIFLGSVSCFLVPFTKNVLQGYLQLSIAIVSKYMVTG